MERVVRAVIFIGVVFLAAACHQNGNHFVATTTSDTVDVNPGDGLCADSGGNCSLRAALMESNALPGVDKVEVMSGVTYTLTLIGTGEDAGATGDLDITTDVEFVGNATIDAAGIDRVLDIHNSAGLVEIDGLTLTGGSAADGAALRKTSVGLLSLIDTEITANTASAGAPVSISGGFNWLIRTTMHANAGTTAGALQVSGGAVTGDNLTIAGNSAGPAIVVAGGSATFGSSTISANSGGGISRTAGTLTVKGTIVADQTSGADCAGTIVSGGYNLESGTSCGLTGPTDQQNAAPGLFALADNGGDVLTMLPTLHGDAFDTGPPASCSLYAVDARQLARPFGAACDVGAVELQSTANNCDPLDLTPGADLRICDMTNLDLTGVDLTGADLSGADLTGSTIAGTIFSAATLDGILSSGLVGQPASLPTGWGLVEGVLFGRGVTVTGFSGIGADMSGLDLSDATIDGSFAQANFSGLTANAGSTINCWCVDSLFTNADLAGSSTSVTGDRIDFDGTDLSGTALHVEGGEEHSFHDATVAGLVFTAKGNNDMEDTASSGLIGTAASVPAPWVQHAGFFIGPGADLSDVDATGTDFSGFRLDDVDFRDADLTNVDFTGADLFGSIFLRTTVAGADFTDTLMPGLEQPKGGPSAQPTFGTPAVMPDGYRIIHNAFFGPWVRGDRDDFTGGDFSGLTLVGTKSWDNKIVNDASFVGADLRELDLYRVDPMTNTDLFGATGTSLTPGSVTNVICPNGGNSDFNGGTCAGNEILPGYVIRRDTHTHFHGSVLTPAVSFSNPWLFHSDGLLILEGPTAGVDWYLDGVLYRDQDFSAPFRFSNSLSQLPLYAPFNGEGPAGSGNSFLLDPGLHEVSAIATHTSGTTEYTALFYVPTP